jgi:hypothetical protein
MRRPRGAESRDSRSQTGVGGGVGGEGPRAKARGLFFWRGERRLYDPMDCTKIQEDCTKILEERTKILEERTKTSDDCTKTPEERTKIPEERTKIPEDCDQPEDFRCLRSQVPNGFPVDCDRLRTTVRKSREDCTKTQDECTKIQDECTKIPEERTKIPEDCTKTSDDCTKIQEDCTKIPEERTTNTGFFLIASRTLGFF